MRKSKFNLVVAAALLCLAALARPAGAEPYVFDPQASEVSFSYSLPLSAGRAHFTSINGTADIDDAAPDKTKVEVIVDTRTLRSSDKLAEGELRGKDFFSVAAYPQMRFQSRSVRAKNPTTADITGQITVKGVTRPIQLHTVLQPLSAKGTRELRATTRIRRSDFNMTAYAFLVGDVVAIEIRAVLRPAR